MLTNRTHPSTEFKYLTVSHLEKKWGLYITNAGHVVRGAHHKKEKGKHPSTHTFTWQKGRVLSEFQLIYLVNGMGIFESKSVGRFSIKAGDVVVLFPNEWHRYKPDAAQVWESYFIGANGLMLENLQQNHFLDPKAPRFTIGFNQKVLNFFLEILDMVQTEKTGYQMIAAGILAQLLGEVYTLNKKMQHLGDKRERRFQLAKVIFLKNIHKNLAAEEVAKELGISYSLFRKEFKAFSGFSPNDYFIDLKISKAKAMLLQKDVLVKEIAYRLGFSSDQHFCKVFKKRVGVSAGAFRQQRIL